VKKFTIILTAIHTLNFVSYKRLTVDIKSEDGVES